MNKRIRKAAMAAVLAVGAVLGGFATAGAAQASAETGVIDGSGNTRNDWSDEKLQEDDESNAVLLWQTVLVADGAFFEDDEGALRPFTEDDISGVFDSITVSATKDWQKDRGLKQTGEANRASFSFADNNLGTVNKKGNVTYEGIVDDVTFKRKTVAGFDEQVYFVNFDGSFVQATY